MVRIFSKILSRSLLVFFMHSSNCSRFCFKSELSSASVDTKWYQWIEDRFSISLSEDRKMTFETFKKALHLDKVCLKVILMINWRKKLPIVHCITVFKNLYQIFKHSWQIIVILSNVSAQNVYIHFVKLWIQDTIHACQVSFYYQWQPR